MSQQKMKYACQIIIVTKLYVSLVQRHVLHPGIQFEGHYHQVYLRCIFFSLVKREWRQTSKDTLWMVTSIFCNFDLAKNILVTLKFILQATILRLLLSASCVGLQYTILQWTVLQYHTTQLNIEYPRWFLFCCSKCFVTNLNPSLSEELVRASFPDIVFTQDLLLPDKSYVSM